MGSGAVEALFAILLRRALFGSAFVPPDDRLYLLCLYPLIGALRGPFAVLGLTIAFAANAVAVISGLALVAPLVSAAIAVAMFRKSVGRESASALAVWAAREIGFFYTFRPKVLLAGGAMVAVIMLGLLSTKVRWSLKPVGTMRSSC